MIENLLVYALLLNVDLISLAEYNKYLDTLFLQAPDHDLLLELEFCSNNAMQSIQEIYTYSSNYKSLDYDKFGKLLFEKLEYIYKHGNIDIQRFGKKTYQLWKLLPTSIDDKEPFHALSYADDPLSWGDEVQTRELYQKLFNFYQE